MSTQETSPAPAQAPWMTWSGRLLSTVVSVMLTISAFMKMQQSPQVVEFFVGKFGYPATTLFPIGVLELLCVVVYVIPRTSVLGAILITGYFGGAIATHVRVEDSWVNPLVLGLVAWAGLALRNPRLRSLLLKSDG